MWNKNNENAIYCTNWLHTVQLLRKKSSNPIPNESQLKKPHKKPNNSYKPKRKGKKPLSIPHPPKPSARVIVPAAESWPRFSDAEKPLFRVPRRRGARWGPAPLTCEKPSGGRSARRVDVLWKQGRAQGLGARPTNQYFLAGRHVYIYIYARECVCIHFCERLKVLELFNFENLGGNPRAAESRRDWRLFFFRFFLVYDFFLIYFIPQYYIWFNFKSKWSESIRKY